VGRGVTVARLTLENPPLSGVLTWGFRGGACTLGVELVWVVGHLLGQDGDRGGEVRKFRQGLPE
jgi:hypothetical protein